MIQSINFLTGSSQSEICNVSTRNQRLMALRSFAKYAAKVDSSNISLQASVNKVDRQKTPGKIVDFMSEDALKTLLIQPDRSTRIGLRNSFFMILMYDTAARCQELLDLQLKDFVLDNKSPYVYLHVKNDRIHTVPIMDKTVEHLKVYLEQFHPAETRKNSDYLYYTVIYGKRNQMSPDTVASFMRKYGETAKLTCSSVPDRVHPHLLRHTRAIHLYRSGVPLVLVGEYLGHMRTSTTKIYAFADTEMKREAIRKASPQDNDSQEPALWSGDKETIKKLYGLK